MSGIFSKVRCLQQSLPSFLSYPVTAHYHFLWVVKLRVRLHVCLSVGNLLKLGEAKNRCPQQVQRLYFVGAVVGFCACIGVLEGVLAYLSVFVCYAASCLDIGVSVPGLT